MLYIALSFLFGALVMSVAMVLKEQDDESKRYRTALKRREALERIYKDMKDEWTEQNLPTNMSVHFEEILKSIPKKDLDIVGAKTIIDLFKDEVEVVVNKKPRSKVDK